MPKTAHHGRFIVLSAKGIGWNVVDTKRDDRVAAYCLDMQNAAAIAEFFNGDLENGRQTHVQLLSQIDNA